MSALTMRNLAPDARAQFHARKTPGRSKHVMRQRQAALGRHTEWIEEEPTQAELDEVREVESRARRRPTDEGPDELADENEQLRQMVRKLEAEAELGLRPSPSADAPLVATGVPPPQQLIRSSSGAQMPAGVPPPPQQLSRSSSGAQMPTGVAPSQQLNHSSSGAQMPTGVAPSQQLSRSSSGAQMPTGVAPSQQLSRSSSGARVATSVPPPQQQQQLGRSRSMGAAGRGRGRGGGSAPAPARDGRTITREMAEARAEAQAAQRELREYQSREDAARQRDEMDAASLAELRLQLDEARASAAREAADAASEAAETAAERSRLREELAAANAELFGLRSPGGGDDDGEGDGGGSGGGAAAMRAAIEVARAEGAERAAAARAEGAATARAEAAARHTEELAAARRAGAAEAEHEAVAVAAEAARRQQEGMGAEASAARTTLQEQLKAARAEVDELTGTLREAHEVARTATAVAGGRALELRALLQMHTVQTEAHRALQRELASTRARLASALAQAEAFYWEARAERGRAQAGEEERCEAQDELDEARRRAVLVQADLHEARLDLRIEASRTAGIRARATALVGGSGAAEQPATAAAAATPTMTPTVSAADLVLHSDALAEDTTKRASASSRVVAEYGLDELLLSASHAKLGR